MKAYGFEALHADGDCGEVVDFQLKDLLHSLLPAAVSEKMVVHRIVSKMKARISGVCEQMDSAWDDCVIPSRRAWPPSTPMHACARQEFQVSSTGLVAWLIAWLFTRHDNLDKEQGESLAIALFERLLNENVFQQISASKLPAGAMARCHVPSPRLPGVCCHVADLLDFEESLEHSAGRSTWELIKYLFTRAPSCSTLAVWLATVVSHVAAQLGASMGEVGKSDALKNAVLLKTWTGRKRRVDEDYVAALQHGVSEGRAGTYGSSLRRRAGLYGMPLG